MARIAAVIARESRDALPAFLFFLVVFHMIAVTKTVILEDYRIDATTASVATVGALIVAKAILLVEKSPLARLFRHRAILRVLWKTLLFGLVATLFRGLEELIHAWVQRGGAGEAAEHLAGGFSWPHFLILQMWVFASLFLYCLASTLIGAIGAGKVRAMLFQRTPEGTRFG